MPRTQRSAAQLTEAAQQVGYELKLLRYAHQHLRMAVPGTPGHDVFTEVFLLHYRKLRAFLFPESPSREHVIAADFLGRTPFSRQRISQHERKRIDETLSRIRYRRGSTPGEWQISEMALEIEAAVEEFLAPLRADFRAVVLENSGDPVHVAGSDDRYA